MTTPQENQPGEAAQDLDRSEPKAECHNPSNVGDGVKVWTGYEIAAQVKLHGWKIESMVPASAFGVERAKRLELENQIAFMLALRGGEVGQTDLGGTEAKADGEPKPTSAREWWIARWPDDEDCYAFEDENSANRYSTGRFLPTRRAEIIHVREVTGEGRKVSADCLEWLESMIMSTSVAPCVHAWCRELLCVLSEEGGRQQIPDKREDSGRPDCPVKVEGIDLEPTFEEMKAFYIESRDLLLAEQERGAELAKLVEEAYLEGIYSNGYADGWPASKSKTKLSALTAKERPVPQKGGSGLNGAERS